MRGPLHTVNIFFLPIPDHTSLQIVDTLGVPLSTDAEETTRPESVFRHDNEVHEETSTSLNHTDLTIRHTK